jgi:transcription-repair coupling factor (superfamily II helicase)
MDGYRRIAEASRPDDLDKLQAEWRDRYGPWPPAVERLLLATRIKIAASEARIGLVETQGEKLMLRQGQDYIMVSGKFPRLTGSDPISKLCQIHSWISSLKGSP